MPAPNPLDIREKDIFLKTGKQIKEALFHKLENRIKPLASKTLDELSTLCSNMQPEDMALFLVTVRDSTASPTPKALYLNSLCDKYIGTTKDIRELQLHLLNLEDGQLYILTTQQLDWYGFLYE